jgi:hypothetical protein
LKVSLLYKPDWDQVKQRYMTWWAREEIEGPLLIVHAPVEKPVVHVPAPKPDPTPEERWLDIEYRIIATDWQLAHTYHAGDAFPWFDTNLGPGSLAIHLGSPPTFDHNTVWYGKVFDDITTAQIPPYNPEEKYWKINTEMARQGMEYFKGKALVSFPDFVENLDTLASLRGTLELLTDLVDHPEDVHRLQKDILERYFDYYDAFEKIIRDEDGGTVFSAFHIWGLGRTCKLQCDMSCMISPPLFNEFVLPYLEQQCERLDNTIYHLDGVDAIKHLDALCSIHKLNAIQWTPGAGQPHAGDPCWYPLYQEALRAGKGVLALGVPPESVQPLIEAIGTRGVMVSTWTNTPEEADELVRQSKRWRKQH